MRYVIGVDIGGTSIRAGLIKRNKIIKKAKKDTNIHLGKENFIKTLFEVIEEVKVKKIKGIGMGCPGPCDYISGKLIDPPNLKPLWGVNLKNIVERKFKVKVKMENDANCAALAEILNRKEKDFVVLTLGTGIGGGVVIDKKLYKGKGKASELGHMIIDKGLELEELASGMVITNKAKRKLGKELLASELAKMAKKGNRKAKEIIKESACYLGIGLSNVSNVFDPEVIVLTGGIKEAGNYYLDLVKSKMNEVGLLKSKIVWSKVKDAGILGAGSLI